jgi:predicted esterase
VLGELVRLPGLAGWSFAAVEALHPFYTRRGEVVRSWMTREDREHAIADNLAYVRDVLRRLADLCPYPWWAACGFSQGAAMAWRAAVDGAGGSATAAPCRAVVALGGDVPPDLDDLAALPVARALLGRGSDDEWYTPEKLAADRARLRVRGLTPEVCEFPGGHEWTSSFREAAGAFLRGLD